MAVKKVKDIFRDLGDAKRILRELKLLRHFNAHENVVTILDIMVHPDNSPDFRCDIDGLMIRLKFLTVTKFRDEVIVWISSRKGVFRRPVSKGECRRTGPPRSASCGVLVHQLISGRSVFQEISHA